MSGSKKAHVSLYIRFFRPLSGFRLLGLAFIIFSLANLAVFALIYIWPGLLEGMWLSADRPWRILTSAST